MAKNFGTHTPRSARTKQAASLCRGRAGVRGEGERRGTMADNKRRRRRCHKMAAECGAARKDAARFLAPLQLKFAVSLWLMASAHTHRQTKRVHTHSATHMLPLSLSVACLCWKMADDAQAEMLSWDFSQTTPGDGRR